MVTGRLAIGSLKLDDDGCSMREQQRCGLPCMRATPNNTPVTTPERRTQRNTQNNFPFQTPGAYAASRSQRHELNMFSVVRITLESQ
jgi:hypothetical protein